MFVGFRQNFSQFGSKGIQFIGVHISEIIVMKSLKVCKE